MSLSIWYATDLTHAFVEDNYFALTQKQHEEQNCPFVKSRYFCTSNRHYRWLKEANLSNKATANKIDDDSLKVLQNRYVLWVGNSYLRQLYEALACSLFQDIELKAEFIASNLYPHWINDDFMIAISSKINLTMATLINYGTHRVQTQILFFVKTMYQLSNI